MVLAETTLYTLELKQGTKELRRGSFLPVWSRSVGGEQRRQALFAGFSVGMLLAYNNSN